MAIPFDYIPVYGGARINEDFKRLTRVLVDTPDAWDKMVDAWNKSTKKFVGFDTESAPKDEYSDKKRWGAAALSPEHSILVGCSLAFDEQTGYYLPYNHRIGKNLPMSTFKMIQDMLLQAGIVFYWNAKHDLKMQRANGHDRWDEIKMFDVSLLAWSADTNKETPALKKTAYYKLGWEMEKYEEAQGSAIDLSYLDPKDVTDYASYDALLPIHLAKAFQGVWKECKFVVDLDNSIVKPIMQMEDGGHPIDLKVILDIQKNVGPEKKRLKKAMQDFVGDPKFDPGKVANNGAVKDAFIKQGLYTGVKTKTGAASYGKEALEPFREDFPFAGLVLDFRLLGNLESKILNSMVRDFREDLNGMRFQYKINGPTTARFASGNKKKNPYYAGFGIQNIVKSPKTDFLAVPGSHLLGYDFLELEKFIDPEGNKKLRVKGDGRVVGTDIGGVLTEGFVRHMNVRRAFIPDKGHLFCHFDYSAEELRIPANMSKDPVMQSVFLEGRDMHQMTAEAVWGKENYCAAYRKKAKPLNFGVLFGGTATLFSKRLNVSRAEAQSYIDKWWKLYAVLSRWASKQVAHGKQHGFIQDAFGRRRWVKHDYDSGRGWAARNVSLNSPVQGTAAELMRLSLWRVHRRVVPKYTIQKTRPLSMVHDEINISIAEEVLTEAVSDVIKVMDIRLPDWKVPMKAEVEIGHSWGETFEFSLVDGTLVPNGKSVTIERGDRGDV